MNTEIDIKRCIVKAKKLFARDFSPLIPLLARFKIETKRTNIVSITKNRIILPEDIEIYKRITEYVSGFETAYLSEELMIELIEYLLLHELKHIILSHFKRKPKDAPKLLWNIACDIAIESTNYREGLPHAYYKWRDFMRSLGLDMPKVETAEKIYEVLKNIKKHVKMENVPCFDDMNLSEKDFEETETNNYLTQYFEYQKMIGNITKSRIDEYEFVLRKFNIINYITTLVATNLNRNSQKLRIPHRRNLSCFSEVYFEQIVKGPSPRLLVAVDTSGSIGEDEFNIFMSGVFNACKDVDIDLILWDVKVQDYITDFHPEKVKQVKFKGRGGTSLDCVIDFLKDKEYSNLVILTDGYFDFGEKAYREFFNLKNKPITTLIVVNEMGKLPQGIRLPDDWDIQCINLLKFLYGT